MFATGFMVGLMEWTCLKVLGAHLEEGEGSLGVHIDVSRIAATVPGRTVTVDAAAPRLAGAASPFASRRTMASSSSAKVSMSA